MGYKYISKSSPHFCPHSSCSTQPKDTPLRLLVFTQTTIYNMDSRCCNKDPLPKCILVFLYALNSTTQTSFVFIIRQHQPLILSILSNNDLPILLSHWCNGIQQLLGQQSILLSLKLLARRKKTQKRKTCLHHSSILPLILPSTVDYANLHSILQLPPPSIARCRFVFHNTQTNKASYPCVPCSNNEIIPVVSMQKVDGH